MALKISCLFFFVFTALSFCAERSLVEKIDENNVALLVGVSHGLPGIDIDIENMEKIATHSAYQFNPIILEEESGTSINVKEELTKLSEDASFSGTLLFYFSGHGGVGTLLFQDKITKIEELRDAIEEGRNKVGTPLERFVFISDSCHSGSLIDPLDTFSFLDLRNETLVTEIIAQKIVDVFTSPARSGENPSYFKKLIVVVSSRPDESSYAGYNGSVFTSAFIKAFEEVEKNNGIMKDLIFLTKKYTDGHHPVEKFVPEDLILEKLIPSDSMAH